MPDDRTTVTELATALGTLGRPSLSEALQKRPKELAVGESVWDQLEALHRSGRFKEEFAGAWQNGQAFLAAPDALRGRRPALVEWTGGRRPPGDEVAPVDLRIDHVYLISCKYLSRTIANPSPARLFDGLLTTTGSWVQGDWYELVAPDEYRSLYRSCLDSASGLQSLPDDPGLLTSAQRQQLRRSLPGRTYPEGALPAYRALCRAVSTTSAQRWSINIERAGARELLAWRLLRVGSAPYFLLGAHPKRPLRLRVASPWDWRQSFELLDLEVKPANAGQPQVDWAIVYRRRGVQGRRRVHGHVEIRWSHGRFAQPPEAKVYLDTASDELPGYFPLEQSNDQPALWG